MSAATKPKSETRIVVEYDLFDLPTAQHKAGLAGLLLQIDFMRERPQAFAPEDVPEIVERTPTRASIAFAESSTQCLFDDLYQARFELVESKTKWAGNAEPVEIREIEEPTDKEGKTRKAKRFVYRMVIPDSPYLRRHFVDGDGLWMKLWRDMLWSIPRGKPTTRIPYNERANGENTKEGADAWKDLVAFDKARKKNSWRTCTLSGALLLGAQAVNAELTPFSERVDHALLLHFWPLTVQVFVPQIIDNDGQGEFVGYSLAIPEVADLDAFCADYPQMLHAELDATARGYRPAGAVIDLPAQAALQFMLHLARLVEHRAASSGSLMRYSVHAIEYMHLVKAGNNIKTMSSGRVAPNRDLLDQYRAIVEGRPQAYRNPMFRAGLLTALLENEPWYVGLERMLLERPWPFFIQSPESPRLPSFGADVSNKIQAIHDEFQHEWEDLKKMNDTATATKPEPRLELLIHRLVTNYVRRKTEDRSGVTWDDFKDKKIVDEKTKKERIAIPEAYLDAKRKVAADAFLTMRSRREQDFSDYFSASICSVGQFLTEEEYAVVADALLNRPAVVKTLTLLALSANS